MQFDKIVKSVLEGFGATYTTKNHYQCLKIYFKDASLAQFAYIMSVWNAADTGPVVVAVKTCQLELDEDYGTVYGDEALDVKYFAEEQDLRAYLSEQLSGYIKRRAELLQSVRKSLIDQI